MYLEDIIISVLLFLGGFLFSFIMIRNNKRLRKLESLKNQWINESEKSFIFEALNELKKDFDNLESKHNKLEKEFWGQKPQKKKSKK